MGRALTLDINTNDAQTRQALARVRKELAQTGQSIDHTSHRGLTLNETLGGLAIGAGFRMATNEFEEAEKAARRTESVIRSTGGVAGVTAEDVSNLADQLARLSGQDDDLIQANANLLLTFTNIRNVGPDKIFDDANLAALNLAAGLDTDLKSATLQLGKALNDPVKGMTALRVAQAIAFQALKQGARKAWIPANAMTAKRRPARTSSRRSRTGPGLTWASSACGTARPARPRSPRG